MARSEFDRILKERLEGYVETAPDVWEGIEKGLAARRRRIVARRVSFALVAAAASLVAAFFIFRDPVPASRPEAPVQIAQTDPVQEEQPSAPQLPDDGIAPIAQQAAAFVKKNALAQAAPASPVKVQESASEPAGEEQPEERIETVPEQEQEAVQNQEQEPVQPQGAQDEPKLGEEDLPADFWTREEASASGTREHTSQISILSNLTTVASEGDKILGAPSSHSSSQAGASDASSTGYSNVEPLSDGNVKFFSPVSLGIQFKTAVADHLYLGTGLSYSYLVSQYDMLVDKQLFSGAYNQLHYLGIPLNLSYNFVDTKSLGVYASVGGAVEKCVSQRYVYASNTLHQKVAGLQWSAQAGIGVEYWFLPRVGIYLDPSLVWFFDNAQPLSIRTQQPLQARFELGFRFKL